MRKTRKRGDMARVHKEAQGVMTKRERVVLALEHREPDRVPVDLRAMDSTGIHGIGYHRFRRFLGITDTRIQIYHSPQQIAKVEDPVLEWTGADGKPVLFDAQGYRAGALPDGTPCELPAEWRPQPRPDGSDVVLDGSRKGRCRETNLWILFRMVGSPLGGS